MNEIETDRSKLKDEDVEEQKIRMESSFSQSHSRPFSFSNSRTMNEIETERSKPKDGEVEEEEEEKISQNRKFLRTFTQSSIFFL